MVIVTTEKQTYSAKSMDYVHRLHICFHCLQSKGGCKLSHKETQSDWIHIFIPTEHACVCVPPCVSHRSHTCVYTLVAKRTQVFDVLLRSQALYSHQFYSDCTGVTDHCTHERRQQSNKSSSVPFKPGKHPQNISVLQSCGSYI